MSDCVRHRDWELIEVREDEGGEFGLYARCGVCGQVKSSLVDFTRDYANCQPIPKLPESVSDNER